MSSRKEIENRVQEIHADLNAMHQGWTEFDSALAKSLKQELQQLQAEADSNSTPNRQVSSPPGMQDNQRQG